MILVAPTPPGARRLGCRRGMPSLVALLFVLAVLAPGVLERVLVARGPVRFRVISAVFGPPIRVALAADAVSRLAPREGGTYREPPRAASIDWSALDAEAVEALFTTASQRAKLAPRTGVLAIRPRRTWGKDHALWVWSAALSLDGDTLVLTPRLFVGGLLPTLALTGIFAWAASWGALVWAALGLFYFLVKRSFVRRKLVSLGPDVAAALAAHLAARVRVAPAPAATATPAPDDEEPAAASERGAHRGLS